MVQANKTFRIFVSSTFADLKEERNTLQKEVFPRLRDLCTEHNCRFQAIDLRWGISEEADLDQQTMKICLEEIERCQKMTPRPNFIVLLGDRYGWRPVPYRIPAEEFHEIYTVVDETNRPLLDAWFKRDDNAVPPVYDLLPRTGKYEDYDTWLEVENHLNSLLSSAILQLGWKEEDKRKYFASATEQEITKGLDLEDSQEHVLGYFRELKNLPPELFRDFVEQDPNSRERLNLLREELKKKITCSVHAVDWTDTSDKEKYLRELGDDIYRSLSALILKQISQFDKIDPFTQEIRDHSSFGQERSKHFAGRTETLEEIEQYIRSGRQEPYTLQGMPGSGKTTVMAYAAQKIKKEHPDHEVICRFIGATPTSSDIQSLLENLCRQISDTYQADLTTPTTYAKLAEEFPQRLHLATPERPLILFLDALDQLSEFENARNLIWLPLNLPKNVWIIVSTTPGEVLKVLKRRRGDENIATLSPMSARDGEKLLENWLHEKRRMLQGYQKQAILDKFAPQGNPLYLRLAFEESLAWKSYSDPQTTVLSPALPGIIRDLFKRLSLEKNHGKLLFYHSLGYLAASRYGLSEDEIIDLLSSDKDVFHDFIRRAKSEPTEILTTLQSLLRKDEEHLKKNQGLFSKLKNEPSFSDDLFLRAKKEKIWLKLPVIIWARLYADLEPYLRHQVVHGATLFTFYHRNILEAVTEECCDPAIRKYYHGTLADYFESGKEYHRELDEVPWQLDKAQSWERLKDFITDIPAFSDMMEQERFNELMIYWRDIGDRYPMVDAYKNSLTRCRGTQLLEESLLTYYIHVARFLFANDHYGAAESLFKESLTLTERVYGQNHLKTAELLDDLAGVLSKKGEYTAAIRLSERSLKIVEDQQGPQTKETAIALNNLGQKYSVQGNFDKAKELLERSLTMNEDLYGPDSYSTAVTLNNLALLFWSKGYFQKAEMYYQRALPIFENYGSQDLGISSLYNNLGLIYQADKKYGKSQEYYLKSYEIRKKILGMDNIDTANSIFNCANLMVEQKQYDLAEPLYRKALAICEENLDPNHRLEMLVICHLAQCLGFLGRYDEALTQYTRALAISMYVYGSNHPTTTMILANVQVLDHTAKKQKNNGWKFW